MKALCPQHKIELEVESKTITVLGKSHSVAIGKCPKCRIQYINRNFFPLCATFEIDHQGYQFLNGLHAPFKKVQILPDTTEETKESQPSAEKVVTSTLKEPPSPQASNTRNPEPVHAKCVWYEMSIPDTCPNDNFPLVHVDNVAYTVNGNPYTASGAYCRHCQTLFQVPTTTVHTINKPKASSSSDAPKKINDSQKQFDTSAHQPPQLPISKSCDQKTQPVTNKKGVPSKGKKPVQPSAPKTKSASAKKQKAEQKQAAKYFDRAPSYTLQALTNSTRKPKEVAQRVAESARQGEQLRKASSTLSSNKHSDSPENISPTRMMEFINKEAGKVPTKLTSVWLQAETGETYIITIVINPQYKNISKGIFSVECDVGKDFLNYIQKSQTDIIFLSKKCVITKYTKTNALDIYLKNYFQPTTATAKPQPERLQADIIPLPNTIQVVQKKHSEIPSEITTVSLRSKTRKQHTLTIVEDVKYQNTKQGIYWRNRSLSRTLLEHLKSNKPEVYCLDEYCIIESYTKTASLEAYLNEKRPSLDKELFVTIWIYKGKTPCPQHPDEVEAVTAYIPSSRDFKEYPLTVNYCRRCRRYYINSIQFNLYAQRHGMPLVNLRSMASSGTYADYSTWQDESLLHFLGYNVNATDNIPEYARQELLAQAMDAGIVSKPNVSSFLEGLIRRSEGQIKMQAAIGKWKRDLQFVANYKIHDQRKVFGNLKIHR